MQQKQEALTRLDTGGKQVMRELLDTLILNVRDLATMSAIKACIAAVIAWMLTVVGHPDTAAMSLLYLFLAESVLAIIHSNIKNTFTSKCIIVPLCKFFGYWTAIALFIQTDIAVNKASLGLSDVTLTNFFILFLALHELCLCIAHLEFLGVPMPDVVKKRIQMYSKALQDAPLISQPVAVADDAEAIQKDGEQ
jgi:phage-related holin